MSDPIARGALWDRLAAQGLIGRTICLVSAEDLRREPVRVGRGVSWEQTLEDVAHALEDAALAPLLGCRDLVITFGLDAALWLGPNKPARLCFAPADAEGDFADRHDGDAVGYMTAMAGALAFGLSQHGIRF